MKEENETFNSFKDLFFLALLGLPIGIASALIEVIFGRGLEYITAIRNSNPMYFLPYLALAGALIVFCYQRWGKGAEGAMSRVFKTAYGTEEGLCVKIIPFAILSTWLTHLFGGSAGREGVAVQLGATISSNLCKKLRIENSAEILVVAGMAAGFAGLFRTPIAAVCFSLEVLRVGNLSYKALIPSFVAAETASSLSSLFGLEKEAFKLNFDIGIDYFMFLKLVLLGLIFGLCGACFAHGLHELHIALEKAIKNPYIRIVSAGAVLSLVMIFFDFGRYSGSGANLIALSMTEGVRGYDWILKALLTMLTLSAGFQGGEVTPLFTVGACLGSVIAPLFGFDPVMTAALGYASVFAAGSNTLLAPVFIGGEIFGFENIPYFAIVCTAAFICNMNKSIYSQQRIAYTE